MKFWRIRFNCNGEELSSEAWHRDVIGIWYGAWNADDFEKAVGEPDPARRLSSLTAQIALGWGVSDAYVSTARRFWGIDEEDRVFTYFDGMIHLARVCSGVLRKPDPDLSRDGNLFKVRKITAKKSFALSRLPDSFRLLSSAGQSNVHEVPGTRRLIELLAESATEEDVSRGFQALPWGEWLDALGPKGWESLCLGYLILEESFLPTGLGVGYTLPTFDIVGRSQRGYPVLAQCKKNPTPMDAPPEFLRACVEAKSDAHIYFFAYGGTQSVANRFSIVIGDQLKQWFESAPHGRTYYRVLRGEP